MTLWLKCTVDFMVYRVFNTKSNTHVLCMLNKTLFDFFINLKPFTFIHILYIIFHSLLSLFRDGAA